ncbi:MAG: A/G-specific adenine glycosylase [Clostridiales Family XIII bacterium]|jgi:A/G-specific adenine glycosylase|nr:A/G-specific adenine glycosylase [Clostridiales Family XIII bacterium]
MVNILTDWYAQSAKDYVWRQDTDPYRVWLSEIMLQQTRAETVIPYYIRFLNDLPTIQSLAEAEEGKLMKLWEGLGYYRRIRNMQHAAQIILQEYGGVFPSDPKAIRSLPGIGEYTTGAIASICFDLPIPAVDGNVLRVIARVVGLSASVDAPQTKEAVRVALEKIYPAAGSGRCGAFTQSLMEIGQTFCIPNGAPTCERCPLHKNCRAHALGEEASYPVRIPKKEKKEVDISVFVIACENKILLCRRPLKGLLGGMWSLPNREMHMNENEVYRWFAPVGERLLSVEDMGQHIHVFTHIRWKMHGFSISFENASSVDCSKVANLFETEEFVWATPREIAEDYALPSAFRKIWDCTHGRSV